ncbi:hypothetical protein Ql52_gp047 [Caulobacter phage Quill_5.2]|uniref:Uncharacterized protein n=1 Tax=Caulobacter phage Quill_5.2 TaxID=3075108 RepID=A0AA96PTW7_9CAUD|nr:hypothetical protein Ql52_gp047 [Caulobacter phage Quill_5.2]
MAAEQLGKFVDDQGLKRQIQGVALVDSTGAVIGGSGSTLVIKAYTPGGLAVVSGQITRPADTTAYAQYDLMADSTSAATPGQILGAVRAIGESIRMEVVRLRTSNASAKGRTIRVHFFNQAPTLTVNDNASFNPSGAQTLAVSGIGGYVGYADVLLSEAGATGATGHAAFLTPRTTKPTNDNNLYFVLEQRDSTGYTPIASEVFTVAVEGQWS